MKKLYLVLLLATPLIKADINKDNIISNIKNLFIEGMPNWIEAINYIFLLSENYAHKKYGSNNYIHPELIREILKKNKFKNVEKIDIKQINEPIQKYVKSAVLSTTNTIYINSKYFQNLTKTEKEAIITRSILQINDSNILKKIGALITIPLITHALILLSQKIYAQSISNKDYKYSNLRIMGQYLSGIFLNIFFTNLYFIKQNINLDIQTCLKLKNKDALASYYTNMHNHKEVNENSELLNFRQPKIKHRLKYISNIKLNNESN